MPNRPWRLNEQVHRTPGYHPKYACKPGFGCIASPWSLAHAGLAPATSNYFCLLHQGDKGAIGMPGRVVSWCICTCLGGHCLLLPCWPVLQRGKLLPSPAMRRRVGPLPSPLSSTSERNRRGGRRKFFSETSDLAI